MKLLDLCSGQWGWSVAFAGKEWTCVGVDLVEPQKIPTGCMFVKMNILEITVEWIIQQGFDFGCASTPCEEFALFGLPHFHPNPKFPANGIKLFNHARSLFEEAGLPYVLENVRSAEKFVGQAVARCGPFALWGTAVPPLLPQGIKKGVKMGHGSAIKGMTPEEKRAYRKQFPELQVSGTSKARKEFTSKWATIPFELSSCVVSYAERILEQEMLA